MSERSVAAPSSGGGVEEVGAEFAWPDVGGLVEGIWDDLAAAWADAAREDPVPCEDDGGRYSGLPGCPGGARAAVDTATVFTQAETVPEAIEAYEAFDRLGEGWIRTALVTEAIES